MRTFLLLCRCNGEVDLGSKALDDVLYRAQLELFPEALLVGAMIFFCHYHTSSKCVSVSLSVRERGEHVMVVHMLASGFVSCTAQYTALSWCVCVCVSQSASRV